MRNRKLNNYIIFPKFQLTLVVINLLIMTVCFILVFYQVYDSFHEINQLGVRLQLSSDSAFFKVMDYHKDKIIFRLGVSAAVCYIFSFILTVIISHKVSGPLFRLKKYFLDLQQNGYKEKLSFREGDYYGELPDIINEGLENIK